MAPPRAGQGRRAPNRPDSRTGWPTGGVGTGSCPGRSSTSPLDLAAVVAWHAPTVGRRRGPTRLARAARRRDACSLFGLGLWLELVDSPPLAPRSGYLRRAVLAAFAMWAFWILAYVLGLSNHDFYPQLRTTCRGASSAAADQQIASAVLWFVAAASFVPVIFWNALHVATDR